MKFPSIRIEGSILAADILEKIEQADVIGQKPSDFGLPADAKVKDEIVRAWADAQDLWRIFRRKLDATKEGTSATTETRNFWVVPLLGLLGYQVELARKGEEVLGKNYFLSHRLPSRDQFVVHIMGYRDSLDKKREDSGPRMSPHALVQEYLNLTEHLYAIVTNGQQLRLLRDSSRLIKLSYLEFDLERMMEEELFPDFALLYRLVHVSRMPLKHDAGAECIIERYHQDSLESGSRIRDGLSAAVEKSIIALANGFLSHPQNQAFRDAVKAGQVQPTQLYQWLLRLIYRILFLMVIEERDLIYPKKASRKQRDIYYRFYSIQRLRKLGEKRYFADKHFEDAWLGLNATFRLFEASSPGHKLGVAPLAGDLFSDRAIGLLNDAQLDNEVLLTSFRNLSVFQHPDTKQWIRVNYGALNVEEFGSVYEGLLKREPIFLPNGERPSFELRESDDDTQSHYTPDELAHPLIHHSLDYIIEEKLAEARRVASGGGIASGDQRAASGAAATMIQLTEEEKRHAYQVLSRSRGLAAGDATGRDGLRIDKTVSQGGDVRDDFPDSPGSRLDPSQHRGGLGAGHDGRVSAVPADSPGQLAGVGNPSSPQPAGGIDYPRSGSTTPGDQQRSWATTHRAATQPYSEKTFLSHWHSTPLAARRLLLAESALLSIRVLDLACGSGHILLNAARRIATELAIVRTGEDQPSPSAFREAVRDVIRHCIYGVDVNPLAVELCKVALWLEAHVPGESLNFLDHHIKCGNAIVGLAHEKELERGIPEEAFKTLPGDDKEIAAAFRKSNKQQREEAASAAKQIKLDLAQTVRQELHPVSQHYAELADLPDHTPDDYAKKQAKFEEITQRKDLWRLRTLANLQVAQFFIPKTPENRPFICTEEEYRDYLTGKRHPQNQAVARANAVGFKERFFHWFLEFPDIMERGGFDCILGNPPYLGGSKISTSQGDAMLSWLKHFFAPAEGKVDLAAYFLRRDFSLLSRCGFAAVITTNSISQGDTRLAGLESIVQNKGKIVFATTNTIWPGAAAVSVSLLSLTKGGKSHCVFLNGNEVGFISSRLADTHDTGDPYRLCANENQCFIGSVVIGSGFVLSSNERTALIAANPANREVVFSYLSGDEINSSPTTSAERFIINFFDWDMHRCQASYPEAFSRIRELVLPQRSTLKRNHYREIWWQYAERGVALYKSIAQNKRVLVMAKVGKPVAFCFVTPNQVFADKVIVFSAERWAQFAIIQSCMHVEWAWKYCTTLESRLSYTPSAIYDTFPFPPRLQLDGDSSMEHLGERYHEHRRQLMLKLQLGLTKTYNLFHDPGVASGEVRGASGAEPLTTRQSPLAALQKHLASTPGTCSLDEAVAGICTLRKLHVDLDHAVLAAYGWDKPSDAGPALPLGHAFHEVDYLPENDRLRYTIHPDARKELLKRLLQLNHKLHAEEEAKGLHKKKPGKKNTASGDGQQEFGIS